MRTGLVLSIQTHFEYGLPHPAIIASTGVGSAEFAIPAPRAGRPRRPWSDGETALLQQRYPTAEPVRSIAEQLQRSKGGIYAKARRLALKRPPRLSKMAACSVPTEMTPVSTIVLPSPDPPPKPTRVRSKINGVRRVWLDEVCERVERLWSAGFHPETIARVLGSGFTKSSVSTKGHRLGYPRRADWKCLSKDSGRSPSDRSRGGAAARDNGGFVRPLDGSPTLPCNRNHILRLSRGALLSPGQRNKVVERKSLLLLRTQVRGGTDAH